jgi:nucleotide-binding universal stress UspA family protein
MFEKIVLATDLSAIWDEIVACAGEFKALGASEIILTHVITVLFMGGMEAALRAEAEPKLEEQKQFLEDQGFKVSVEMPTGLPAHSLNHVAWRHGADLIVVGSHGKSLWREAVLGSVSSAILHQTRYPTLLLNVQLKKEGEEGTCRLNCAELLRHVLFPTDFSDTAARAGDYVVRLAPKGVLLVTVLHALDVTEGEGYSPEFREAESLALEFLAATRERLLQSGISRVETLFDPGHPLPAILQVLETRDISLIIMGTQGKGFIKEVFLGSVAHHVSRLASCPVLLIPPASR